MINIDPPFNVTIDPHHRNYNALLTIVMASDSLTVALLVQNLEDFDKSENRRSGWKSRNNYPVVQVTTSAASKAIFERGERTPLVFDIVPDPSPEDDYVKDLHLFDFDFLLNVASGEFLTYYENISHWLYDNVSKDKNQQPEIFRFGRVIRNSIAHGGAIDWRSQNVRPVSWRGFSYCHQDDGTVIIGPYVSVADLVLLILDLDATLGMLGCTINGAGIRQYIRK